MRTFLIIYALLIFAVVSIAGFRGSKTRNTPIEIFPDMDHQAKFHPQGANTLFRDGRDDRPKPEFTVARGTKLNQKEVFSEDFEDATIGDRPLLEGRNDDGSFYDGFPFDPSYELIELGRQRYDIHCTVCHGAVGDGAGITRNYGIAATSYHSDRIRDMPDGEIYDIIVNGKGTMFGLGHNLDLRERWAIVLYVRALQRSQLADKSDLPSAKLSELGL
ncbi:MAG: cytochrome c [Puniceicoccaceae bacterium]|nr:MAG: cytochrome c [Puniceicoccaceae bacterium]